MALDPVRHRSVRPESPHAQPQVRALLHRRAPEVRATAVPAELVLSVGVCGSRAWETWGG